MLVCFSQLYLQFTWKIYLAPQASCIEQVFYQRTSHKPKSEPFMYLNHHALVMISHCHTAVKIKGRQRVLQSKMAGTCNPLRSKLQIEYFIKWSSVSWAVLFLILVPQSSSYMLIFRNKSVVLVIKLCGSPCRICLDSLYSKQKLKPANSWYFCAQTVIIEKLMSRISQLYEEI